MTPSRLKRTRPRVTISWLNSACARPPAQAHPHAQAGTLTRRHPVNRRAQQNDVNDFVQHRFVNSIAGSEHLYAGRSIYEYLHANMGTMLDALDPRSDADKLSALAADDEVKGFFIYFFQWAAVLLLGGIKGGDDTDCMDDLLQADYQDARYADENDDFASEVGKAVEDCNQLIAHIAQLYEDLTQI